VVGVAVLRAQPIDPLRLPPLGDEGLDGGDTAQVVGERARQVADAFPNGGVVGFEATLISQRTGNDHRDRHECHQGQRWGDHEEERADQHHVGGRANHLRGANVKEPFQLVDVVVDHRQQPTRGTVLKPGEFQRLQMAVQLRAGGMLDRLCQVSPNQRGGVVGDRFEYPDHHRCRRQHQQLGPAVIDTEPVGQEGGVAAHHHVHGHTDEQLRQHIKKLVEHRQPGAEAYGAVVVLGEVP